MQKRSGGGYNGLQKEIRDLKVEPGLLVVENQYSDKDYVVELEMREFSSVCPKTGLPDFARVIIRYRPGRFLVEQKSLKLYLNGYRHIGIFQEHATNKILDDFVTKVKPRWVKIETIWNVRGGIRTRVEREWCGEEN